MHKHPSLNFTSQDLKNNKANVLTAMQLSSSVAHTKQRRDPLRNTEKEVKWREIKTEVTVDEMHRVK